MRQVLDAFELLERTNPSPDKPINWRLVSASTNSPFTVVAEAIPVRPGFDVDAFAREQKLEFVRSFAQLRSGTLPPIWTSTETRRIAKGLLARVANGIASTKFAVADSEPPLTITADDAKFSVPILEAPQLLDHPRVQIGSVEGYLADVSTYYRKAAIKIIVRRTRELVTCLVPEEVRTKINATFDDVWRGRRVIVRGRVHYNDSGSIEQVVASVVDIISDVAMDTGQIRDPSFTNGLSAEEYLKRLRDGEIG